MNKIVFILIYLLNISSYGQTPPFDQNWEIIFDDGFDSPNSFNFDRWEIQDVYDHGGEPQVYLDPTKHGSNLSDLNSNVHITNGRLVLQCKDDGYTCLPSDINCVSPTKLHYWTSGEIDSKSWEYLYGYYEITCKLPKGQGLWPAFWLWNMGGNSAYPCWQNEIDVFEMDGSKPLLTTNNLHTCLTCKNPANPALGSISYGCLTNGKYYEEQSVNDFSLLDHKYSVEWLPDRLVWYYDDRVIRTVPNNVGVHFPQRIVANLALFPWEPPPFPTNQTVTNMPSSMEIDNIKAWKLIMDCNTVIKQNNFDFTSYIFGVKKSITLINTIVPVNADITLRATDFLLLESGCEVPLGAQLTLAPTPCHENPSLDFTLFQSKCIKDYLFQNNYYYNNGDIAEYNASNIIEVGGKYDLSGNTYNYNVNTGSTVSFNAGNSISLKPGFRAYAGSTFNAKITPCP